MAADALQFNLLKPRLLSDPQAEVYRRVGKWDISFDLPQKCSTLVSA
jgi:hypothetical protein